jgi:glyoxylase-like metal-dependent hydrolase (beta-lactamase superfamily II)
VADDKVALIDTVEHDFEGEFLDNINWAIGERQIDYLVVNHMEPDHSSLTAYMLDKYPEMKIVYNGTIIKSAAGTRQIKFIPMYKGIDYRSLSMLLVSAEEDLNYVVPIDMNKQMLTERAELVKIINENK